MKNIRRYLAKFLALIMIVSTIHSASTSVVAQQDDGSLQQVTTEAQGGASTIEETAAGQQETPAAPDPGAPQQPQEPVQQTDPSGGTDLVPVTEGEAVSAPGTDTDTDALTEEETVTEQTEETAEDPTIGTEAVNTQVTVIYEATAGGTTLPAEEIVSVSEYGTLVYGSEAVADGAYTFENWTDENGQVVSEDAFFIPDASAFASCADGDVITYTANFRALELVTQEKQVGETLITVQYEEDAFTGSVTLDAYEITRYQTEYAQVEAAVEQVLDEETSVEDVEFAAFDIFFTDENGMEVEPEAGRYISVSIDTTGKETPAEVSDVLHITNNNEVEVIAADTTGDSVDFTTGSFSIYVVVGGNTRASKQGNTASAEVYREGANGRRIGYKSFRNMGSHDVTFTQVSAGGKATFEVKGVDKIHAVVYHSGKDVFHKVTGWTLYNADSEAFRVVASFADGTPDVVYYDNATGEQNISHFAWLADPYADGKIDVKVYLKYDNYIPDDTEGNLLEGPISIGEFGPKKDNSPYFTVTLDLAAMEAQGAVPVFRPHYTNSIYYTYRSSGLSTEAGNRTAAVTFFDKYVLSNLSDTSEFVHWFGKTKAGGLNYVGYVLKRENDGWHLDGVAIEAPTYMVELYERDNQGDRHIFDSVPSLHPAFWSDPNSAEAKFEMRFRKVFGDSAVIDWTDLYHGTIIDKDGKGHTFTITPEPDGSGVADDGEIQYREVSVGVYHLAIFTVEYADMPVGAITIEKKLAGDAEGASVTDKEFFFNITPDGDATPLTFSKTADGYVYDKNGAVNRIPVKGGEKVKISGLDAGKTYVVREETPQEPAGYTVSVTSDPEDGKVSVTDGGNVQVSVTNTYTRKTGSLIINKQVVDKTNGGDFENKTYTFKVTGPDGYEKTVTITGSGSTKIDNVPAGTYTVKEDAVNAQGYTVTTTYSTAGGSVTVPAGGEGSVTVTNTAVRVQDSVVLRGKKTWIDPADAETVANRPALKITVLREYPDGTREQVKTYEFAKGATAYEINDPELLIRYDLETGAEYTYIAVEEPVSGYTLTAQSGPRNENGVVVTDFENTINQKYDTKTVTKTWHWPSDEDVPPVTINLLRNGEQYDSVELTNGQTTHTFTNLPRYNVGRDYVEGIAKGAKFTYTLEEVKDARFNGTQDGDSFTNDIVQEYVTYSGEKKWVAPAGTNLPEIEIKLMRDGVEYRTAKIAEGTSTTATYKFENVPVYDIGADKVSGDGHRFQYEVVEIVPAGYSQTKKTVSTDAEGNVTVNFENTIDQDHVTINGIKNWKDPYTETPENRRDITIELYRDDPEMTGKPYQTITLTGGATTYSFGPLDRYDVEGDGHEYDYKVHEIVPEGYQHYAAAGTYGEVLTNPIAPKTVDIIGEKKWIDPFAETPAERPDVTIVLYRDDVEHARYEIKDGATVFEFKGLDRYAINEQGEGDGHEYRYRVEEEPVEGYDTLMGEMTVAKDDNGNLTYSVTLENKINQEETAVSIEKIWDDADNKDGARPESVSFMLTANGKEATSELVAEEYRGEFASTVTFTADAEGRYEQLTHTWEHLNVYDENGTVITYDVEELDKAALENHDYTSNKSEVTGSATEGYSVTFTNSYTPDPDPEKTVNGEVKVELQGDRTQIVTYTITGTIPDRRLLEEYEITDQIEDVLEFRNKAQATVKIGNTTLPNSVISFDDANGLLSVKINNTMTGFDRYKGQTITVTFYASIKENADLSDYYVIEAGEIQVPNKATATLRFPDNGPKDRSKDTEEVIITPPPVTIEKTIEGGEDKGTHKTLKERNETFTFVIETQIPERDQFVSFVITDEIEDVLEFASDAEVTIGGAAVDGIAVIDGQTLTVTIDAATAEGNMGKTVRISFDARIKETADNLSAYIGRVTGSGVVEVPNDAEYELRFADKVESDVTDEVFVTPPDPDIDKGIGDVETDIEYIGRGDDIPYVIETRVPERSDVVSFVIEDKLEHVLQIKPNTAITATITDAEGNATDISALARPESWEENGKSGTLLRVTISGEVLAAHRGENVTVAFTAVIRENADLSAYIAPSGQPEIDNRASYIINVPNAPVEKETPESTVIPDDPEPVKEVEGKKDNYDMTARDEEVTYTIRVKLPERDNIDSFVIEDVLEEVLELRSGAGQITVTVNGNAVRNAVRTDVENGRDKIIVTLPANVLTLANKGKDVVVTFKAAIKEGADLTPYMEASEDGRASVPNKASYTMTIGNESVTKWTNEPTITPPDPEPEKKVGEKMEEHYDMPDLTADIPYTITTAVPDRNNLVSFVIEDTLVDVLVFKDGTGEVQALIVNTDGDQLADVTQYANVKDQTLTVTLPGDVINSYHGAEIKVTFVAKVKDGADVSGYLQANGRIEIGNKATTTINLNVPGGPITKETPEVTVTPPDPIYKEVHNAARDNRDLTHAYLAENGEVFTYTIRTKLPQRPDTELFFIEDTLVDEIVFAGNEATVEVTVGGVSAEARITINGQHLEIDLAKSAIKGNDGKAVVVTFPARIADGADLTKWIDPATGEVMIPNEAKYFAYRDGSMSGARRPANRTPDLEVTSNEVYVTPKAPKPVKTVNGAAEAKLESFDEVFTYEITVEIPVNGKATTFTVTDKLEKVLEFASDAAVTIGGVPVAGIASIDGQTLTVKLEGDALKAQMGKTMVITFDAKVKEGQDMTPYIEAGVTDGTAKVPNEASYRMEIPNGVITDITEEVNVITKPELIDITVTKTWDDDNNRDGVRPEMSAVTVRLLRGGTEIDKAELNEANKLTHTFKGLRKYTDDGTLIVYKITEDAIDVTNAELGGYTLVEDENTYTYDKDGALIAADLVNVHTPGRTDIAVRKVWEDDSNRWSTRPASITVRLVADGVPTGDVLTLDESNGWAGRFTEMFIHEPEGKKIAYTVTEDTVDGYDVTYTDGTGEYDKVITNTLHTGTLNVTKSVTGGVGGNVAYTFIVTHVASGLEYTRVVITGSGTRTLTDVPAGTYRVTEVGANASTVAGYTMTTTGNGQTATVVKDGTASVTITNAYTAIPVPEDPPVVPPAPPAPPVIPPAEDPAVLGARRTADGEAVLGARRGITGEERKEKRLIMTLASSALALLFAAVDRRKKRVDE